ncbi:MAG: lasso peptide biosynthesis B2 protein [Minicystis sp.]
MGREEQPADRALALARALPPRLRLGAAALSLRLRLGGLLRRRSLPVLLGAIDARSTPAARVPLSTALGALDDAQALLSRLRLGRFVPDTCLYRSLARYSILRRAGHPARFVMGLRPSEPEILGHAWVELDGAPVGETVDPALVVTFAYPDRAAPSAPR